ncbi:MAG: TonB-dependent receptor, partial [Myxococcota bacterium]|nr:TonB-dependent receptor [Myxococcota bacterium]
FLFSEVLNLYADPFATSPPPNLPAPYTVINPNPTDPRQVYKDLRQFQDIKTWDVNGRLTWEIQDTVEFSVVGSYREESRLQNFDGDLTELPMVAANISAATTDRVVDAHLASLEPVSLDNDQASFEWLVGLFFLEADGNLSLGLPGSDGLTTIFNGCTGLACTENTLLIDNQIQLFGAETYGSNYNLSLAPYAHLSFLLADDQLELDFGIRWNYDKKRGVRQGNEVVALLNSFIVPEICVQPGYPPDGEDPSVEEDWSSWTGEMVAQYRLTDENNIYGKFTHGWKPGYINGYAVSLDCAAPPTPLDNAEPESVNAVEIGSKNRFMDNTIQANLTGFYYNYDNLQVASQFDNTGFIQNAAEARTWGVELEGIWQPTFLEELALSVVYGYLNAKYVDYQGFDFTDGTPNTDFSGNQMVRAPEHSATFAAEYLWRMPSSLGALIPRIQYTVSSSIYFTAANRPEDEQPWFGKLQVRMRWESDDARLFLEGFGDNLTDQDVRSTQSVGSALLGRPVLGAYEPPRTWGIRIGASY